MITVFFDLGATLITGPDRGPAGRLAERLSLSAEQKKVLSGEMMTANWQASDGLAGFLTQSFNVAESDAREAAAWIWDTQFGEVEAIDGAYDAVARMLDAEFQVGMVSNIWHPYLEGAKAALGDAFEKIGGPKFFSYAEGSAKPDVDVFQSVVAQAGVPADKCVMIGDTYEMDILPALEHGLGAIWVLHRPEKEQDDLVRVLNGDAPCPNVTLRHIQDLRADDVYLALGEFEDERED